MPDDPVIDPTYEDLVAGIGARVIRLVRPDQAAPENGLRLSFRIGLQDGTLLDLDMPKTQSDGDSAGGFAVEWVSVITVNLVSCFLYEVLKCGVQRLKDRGAYESLKKSLIVRAGQAAGIVQVAADLVRDEVLRHFDD
jgi:hypothetical protein